MDTKTWLEARIETDEKRTLARRVLDEVRLGEDLTAAVHRYPLADGGYLAKHTLVSVYHELVQQGEWPADPIFLSRIRLKPVRTLSGVTTVTVLTKPYPCPATCIFCPSDVRMPKSYIPDEPGARRALENEFDPFRQVASRLEALRSVGHPTDKIELLILGGTWSAYRRDYQEWFIRRCFEAMNGCSANTLEEAFAYNETAEHRNVGLSIETRPDRINPKELAWLRSLGVTKVQMGAQSFDNDILLANQRGHTVEQTRAAVALLRAGGFKIVLHWMPNLLGATPESDRRDFIHLWDGFCPDELKIYPNQLLDGTELLERWKKGQFVPYTTPELVDLIADVKETIPRYCRVNRVIRDIPSTYVVEGNKVTSLRQDIQEEMKRRGTACQCIRCREVGQHSINPDSLALDDLSYQVGTTEEHFLSFVTPEDRIVGFLRLSLPGREAPQTGLADLDGAAIIREIHVYGQSLEVGKELNGAAQHVGLGSQLLEIAQQIAAQEGYQSLAVISAVGTRGYYLERGFARGQSYLTKSLQKLQIN